MDFWGLPWTFPGITHIYGHARLLRGFWGFKFRSAPGLFCLLINKWFSGFTTDYIYMHYLICNITDYGIYVYIYAYILYIHNFPKGFYREIIIHTLKNTTRIIRNKTTSMLLFTKNWGWQHVWFTIAEKSTSLPQPNIYWIFKNVLFSCKNSDSKQNTLNVHKQMEKCILIFFYIVCLEIKAFNH